MQERKGLAALIVGGAALAEDTPASPPRKAGREVVDLLGEIPLFSTLSRRHLGRVASVAVTKRYAANSPLVRVGKQADAFYVILDGSVRVDLPGHPVLLAAGDFFGEMALIDGEPRSATVTAADEVLVLMIPRAKFLKLLADEPKIALAIMATLTQRLRAAETGETS